MSFYLFNSEGKLLQHASALSENEYEGGNVAIESDEPFDANKVYFIQNNKLSTRPRTKEEQDTILDIQSKLEKEIANKQYQRDRKAKYDALNQLELISDDAINGTTTHKDAILAIKAEIPKPV